MKKYIIILIACVWSFFTYAQVSSDKNYIYTTTYNTPVLDGNQSGISETNKTQQVTYFDGLGRPIQSIIPNAGGNEEDIISHYEYDEFGRQTKSYLPYAENLANNLGYIGNAGQNISSYYQSNFSSDFQNGVNPYSETILEASPLARVKKQGAPGSDWKVTSNDTDHTVKVSHFLNSVNDVINFEVEYTADDYMQPNLVFKGFYNYAELHLTVVKNENWQPSDDKLNTTETYTDKNGRTLLTRNYDLISGVQKALNTYYVYDYFGNLVYVITPKAADTFVISPVGNSNFSQDAMREKKTLAENGGISLAMFVMSLLSDYKYMHQSEIGSGTDYGFTKTKPTGENFLDNCHYIEVSGILEEKGANTLYNRIQFKHKQIENGSNRDKTSSIIVTLFNDALTQQEKHK